ELSQPRRSAPMAEILCQRGLVMLGFSASITLVGNLLVSALLGLATLLVGTHLRAFSLEVFSG
ncbi:hypothetical protein, partial [Novosphingobium sp. TCA1]|uniref:hypothetical protein n=1 Tax=Novosphingobium sp. TCA1 TaxID=2682474 RepID=UPI001F436B46